MGVIGHVGPETPTNSLSDTDELLVKDGDAIQRGVSTGHAALDDICCLIRVTRSMFVVRQMRCWALNHA